MSNILDYIHWRGDIPFSAFPVGEVDGLILAQLSMYRWECAWTGPCRISELSSVLQAEPVSVGFTTENDKKMMEMIIPCERFGNVLLSDYMYDTDKSDEKQFAAITLHLSDGTLFISYRGTDKSITGWKEDCNMAFSKPVPSQEQAAEYLTKIASKYKGPIQVGGHSKGGNLAMYAAAQMDDAVRERICTVFNYDGPGLSDKIDATALYARISGRLRSFVPQGSVVGMLLAHPDQFIVVKSNSIGVFQHDPYSWQVDGPHFTQKENLAEESVRFDIVFRQWLSGVSEEQREELVDTLFSILSATKADAFDRDFWIRLVQNSKEVKAAIEQVSPNTKNHIMALFAEFTKLAIQPVPKIIEKVQNVVEANKK